MSNDIEPKTKTDLAPPAGDMGGFQPLDPEDVIRLPRLQLAQGGKNNPYIKEGVAKDGDLINSLSKENYGQSIEVIPLVQRKSTRIRWATRDSGGEMLCIARDGIHGQGDPGDTQESCLSCPYGNVKKAKDKDDDQWCSSNREIVALVRDTKEPILLTADSIKPADRGIRDMLDIARLAWSKGIRMYQKSYIIKVIEAEYKGYNFYKLACSPGNENKVLEENEWAPLAKQAQFFEKSKVGDEAVPAESADSKEPWE